MAFELVRRGNAGTDHAWRILFENRSNDRVAIRIHGRNNVIGKPMFMTDISYRRAEQLGLIESGQVHPNPKRRWGFGLDGEQRAQFSADLGPDGPGVTTIVLRKNQGAEYWNGKVRVAANSRPRQQGETADDVRVRRPDEPGEDRDDIVVEGA